MDDDEGNYDIPTERDLRFIDDDDLISSDDTVNEGSTSNKPKKYNQLHPKAKFVHTLLKSAKPKVGSIWKTVITPSSVDLLYSSNLNCDLFTASTGMMAKSSKRRKHEEVSSDGEGGYRKKKKSIVINTDVQSYKNDDRKRDDHNMSASDDEDCDTTFNRSRHSQNTKALDNTSNYNGHVSSCENDSSSERDLSVNVKTFGKDLETNQNELSDCESAISHDSDSNETEQPNLSRQIQDNSVLHSRPPLQSKTNEKSYHKRCFTQEDEEEISKFSCLMSEKLKEKKNIWILQCPSDMNCTEMVNQYLNLSDGCQLADGDRKFEAYSYKNNQNRSVTLAVPSQQNHFQLCTIPISGNIIVEESVSVEDNISYIPESCQAVELPQNLRTRHPLLGLDYGKQPRTVIRKERMSKKKKKKGLKPDDIYNDGVSELELDSSNTEHSKKSKKKKHRNKEGLANAGVPELELNSCSIIEHSKKKKKKKSTHMEDLADIGVQEQLLDHSNEESKVKRKKKKKHINDESFL